MTASWKDVRRASIPVEDLPVLAELRGAASSGYWSPERLPGSRGSRDRTSRTRCWCGGSCRWPAALLYTEREGAGIDWASICRDSTCPQGDGLGLGAAGTGDFPRADQGGARRREVWKIRCRSGWFATRSMPTRPASGLRCSLSSLAAWAERSTSAQLAALEGAWTHAGSNDGSEAQCACDRLARSLPLTGGWRAVLGDGTADPAGLPGRTGPAGFGHSPRGRGPAGRAGGDWIRTGSSSFRATVFKRLSRASIRMMRGRRRRRATEAAA